MPDLRSDRKEHVTAPMATLGALRNPREVSLHPHGTQILGFWYRALVLAPTASCAHRATMGRASRVAPFDTAAAQQAGDLMAVRHKKGRPDEMRDTMIAGIVLASHAKLATHRILRIFRFR